MHTTEEGLVASLSTVEGDRSYYYFDRDGYVRMCVMSALQGIIRRYDMSTSLRLTKWLLNFRTIFAVFSLQMTFLAQKAYLNSLYTLVLCIAYFKYRYFTSVMVKLRLQQTI